MLDIHDTTGSGRKIWIEMDQPLGTLDMWYYFILYEDLPRFIVRMKKDQMIDLLSLLHLSAPKKI